MSKKLILVMVFALVFAFSCAAYAEVQNVKVGGDLTSVGLSRQNLNFQRGLNAEVSADNEFASIARIRIDADLTDSVGVTFRLLNERVWGGAPGDGVNTSPTQVDVDVAYATLKEFMKPTINVPLNLVIGRQNIKIGSGLLVGANGTNQSNTTQLPIGAGDLSVRSAFDAIVGVWDFTPEFTVITGFVKASEVAVTAGKDLDGYIADATYKFGEDAMNAALEGTYVLAHQNRANINNYGGRLTAMPIKDLNIEAEYVFQVANARAERASDAVRLNGNFALTEVVWKPSIGVDYTRLSKYWNQMFESMTPADLTNLIFANTDMSIVGATVSATPMDDVMLKVRYANLSKAKKDGAVTTNSGTGFPAYATNAGVRALGYELDAGVSYDYTSDVQFGLNYGMLKPGKAFVAKKTASQVLGSMRVSF